VSAARRSELQVVWEAVDISRDITDRLLLFSYVDNLTGAADGISITLEDRDGLWSGPWRPKFGDTVECRLKADPWLTTVKDLRLGTFAHDSISLVGPPKAATIKAVSAPMATGLRRHKRNRPWRGVPLRQIAQDIADRAGLLLDWSGDPGRNYRRREQKDKSDLEFLDEACKEVGRDLKVTEKSIVIFQEQERDSAPAVGDIDLHGGFVKTWQFDADDSARYGNCHIKFFDATTGKVHEGQFPPVNTTADGYAALGLDPDGQTLELRMPASDKNRAADICKGRLRAANRFATSGSMTVVGDPGLVAGVTFNLVNAFGFDGKFIITRAEHLPIGGYTCHLQVRRCIEGF